MPPLHQDQAFQRTALYGAARRRIIRKPGKFRPCPGGRFAQPRKGRFNGPVTTRCSDVDINATLPRPEQVKNEIQ